MAKVKDLYIATSMEDLNKKCEFVFDKGRSIKTYLNMVNKTYQAAETAFQVNDEERAYILYMRYGDAVMQVRKTKEFQQQSDHYSNLFGTSKLTSALERAENLSKALKKRYMKLAESKNAKNAKESLKIEDAVPLKDKTVPALAVEQSFPEEKITCQQLHQLLYKQQKQIIVMDIRSIDEYQESHCIHPLWINVPQTAIAPGSVTSKIEKGIPLDHIKVWNTRNSADLIVLMDWHSNFKRLQNKADPLRSLKDSIYKWEQTKELAREPVVLEGGYADWLESYPQFTSNPRVNAPDNKPKTSNINSLLDFTYDDLRKSLSTKPNSDSLDESESSDLTNGSMQSTSNGVKDLNASIAKTKKTALLPSVQQSQKVLPSESNTSSNLYFRNDKHSVVPKSLISDSSIPNGTAKTPLVPSFDRSIKPKPSTNQSSSKLPSVPTSPKQAKSPKRSPLLKKKDKNSQASLSEKTHSQSPAVSVDRSTKPKLPIEQKLKADGKLSQISNAKQAEINDLELRLVKMKQEQEEKEKRVLEIEEKKRLHLLSLEADMKRKAEELDEREAKAQKELAATMRQDKPRTSQFPAEVDSVGGSQTKNAPAAIPASSKSVANPQVTNTNASVFHANATMDQPQAKVEPKDLKNGATHSKKITQAEPPASKPQASTQSATKPTASATNPLVPKPSTPVIPASTAIVRPNVPPPTYASVKSTPMVSSDTTITTSKARTSAHQPTSNLLVYKESLKDESETSSFGLKRSFSSPNIAKMVQQDMDQPTPNIPNRQYKPNAQTVPSRDSKPNLQEEPDPMVTRLNLSLRGVVGGGGESAKCGLRNLGNSCYMNSVLQCMFNITQLADYFLTFSYRQDVKRNNVAGHGGKVAEIFAVLLRAIWSGQYRYLIPTDMKQVAGEIKEEFAGYTQEDSHEFLLVLLDALHEDLNKITNFKYEVMPDNDSLSDQEAATLAWKFYKKRNESIIIELFSGQYKATTRCQSCGTTSRKFDTFQFLTLSLPTRSCTLDELIRDFSKEEKLTGDNKWKCPKCKVLRNAVRTIEIWKLPPVLIIHLKRFVYSGLWRDKIHTNVTFPVAGLNLTRFTCGPTTRKPYDLFAVSVRCLLFIWCRNLSNF